MNINVGKYIENMIRCSNYSKKDLCAEINKRYVIGSKPISYTTFSNNLKNGDITLNEIIAIATILDIDLNKVVNAYKNKYNQLNNKENGDKMKREIVNVLNNEGFVEGVEFKEENIYEIAKYEVYEGYHLSEDGNTAIMLRVDIDGGIIQEVAYFTNFLDILGECDMSLKEFKELPINEKLCFLSDEGMSAMEILGEEPREVVFTPSKYIAE